MATSLEISPIVVFPVVVFAVWLLPNKLDMMNNETRHKDGRGFGRPLGHGEKGQR